MPDQDNEPFRTRVAKAVADAVVEAGRSYPGSKEVRLDLPVAFSAICDALANLAYAGARAIDDRDGAAAFLAETENAVVSRLRFIAEQIRSGDLPPPPVSPLRLVD